MIAHKKHFPGAGKGHDKDASTSTAPKPGNTTSSADPSPEPIYFWQSTEPETGFLSQWYQAPFRDRTDPSIIYLTAEHYMMYQKAVLFDDPVIGARILAAEHPREVKALGRVVAHFDASVWERERVRIVRDATWYKFSLPSDLHSSSISAKEGESNNSKEETSKGREKKEGETNLRGALLATSDHPLVEASPHDRTWGIGFKAADAERNRRRWGFNLLGKCLMEVREQLRSEGQGSGV